MRAVEVRQSGGSPTISDACHRAWGVFWALDRRRQSNGYGANAVSHQEIEACARLYGARLEPWEVAALDAMEAARLRWLNADEKDRQSAQQMTPGLFRSLFG